jgi:hypothetical protein
MYWNIVFVQKDNIRPGRLSFFQRLPCFLDLSFPAISNISFCPLCNYPFLVENLTATDIFNKMLKGWDKLSSLWGERLSNVYGSLIYQKNMETTNVIPVVINRLTGLYWYWVKPKEQKCTSIHQFPHRSAISSSLYLS